MMRVVLLALAVALAGCSQPMVTTMSEREDLLQAYWPYYAGGRELPVEVHGAPFGGDGRCFAAMVAERLAIPPWYAPARPRPAAGPADFRLVLRFDVPGPMGACATDVGSLPGRGETLTVQGAFCYRGQALTEAFGRTPRPAAADDPGFGRLLDQVMFALMPPPRREDRMDLLESRLIRPR